MCDHTSFKEQAVLLFLILKSYVSPLQVKRISSSANLNMWCIAQFVSIWFIFKNAKNTHGRMLVLVML